VDSGNGGSGTDIDRSLYVHVQQNERTESTDDETPGGGGGGCVLRTAVIQNEKAMHCGSNDITKPVLTPLNDSTCCHSAVTCCHSPPGGQSRRLYPSPGGEGRALPRLRPAADVVDQTRWREVSLLRLPEEGKTAGEGATAPGGSRPPDVFPDEGRTRPVRRLRDGEGGLPLAGGTGEGV